MTTFRQASRVVAVRATSTLLGSCASAKPLPPLPLQAAFAADWPFTIESALAAVAPGDRTARCRVRLVVVRLSEVRSDTVFFSGVVSHVPARGEPRCSLAGPGLIALGGQAQVQSETVRSDSVLTLFAALAILPAIFGLRVILYLVGI